MAAYLEKQGRGCPWGKRHFTEEGGLWTTDAHVVACACCGFRNMTGNFRRRDSDDDDGASGWVKEDDLERPFRDINLFEPKMQAVLKMQDNSQVDDDEDQSDHESTGSNDCSLDSADDSRRRSHPRARTRSEHLKAMSMDPLEIPTDADDFSKTAEVEVWKLYSAWPNKTPEKLREDRDQYPSWIFGHSVGNGNGSVVDRTNCEPNYYHLHPEFVRVVDGPDGEKEAWATVCSVCEQKIFSLKLPDDATRPDPSDVCAATPRHSIAGGIDFGNWGRSGLQRPTLRERLIMAKCRHCLHVIKTESNVDDRRTKERGQSAIKGCGIMFDHDSPQVVRDLLLTPNASPQSINSHVTLQFVGPDGERDKLVQKVLGSPNVWGRWFVIWQHLAVCAKVNPHYQNDNKLPKFEEFKEMIENANKSLVKEATHTNDEHVARQVEINKDDVRNVRILPPGESGMDETASGDTSEEGGAASANDGKFPFRCSFLTSAAKSTHGSDADANHEYLVGAAQALGIGVGKEQSSYSGSTSRREREGLNEFEHGDELLCKAFPDVFMFGRAYESKKPALDRSQARHLLMQFTTNAASCQPLLFQLFDQMKRQSAILGMHGKCVSDKEAFEEFAHEFSSEEFHEKMRDAVKNPAGESAKFVLRKIVPFLTTAGRKTVFGAVERNKCAGEILALGRKYGCASDFLTFGIDDVNHPNAIRFAVSSSDNDSFPSRISNASHVAMSRGLTLKSGDEGMIPFNWSDRHKRMIENPVGAALAYKQVVEDVMSILVGMKTERKGRDKTNLTSPSDPDSVGMVGTPWAYFGKTETTGSGALHFHVILWGGLSPELLEEVSSVSELCSAVASVLNSTHCACLESHHHVRDLVVKETKSTVARNKRPTAAAARDALFTSGLPRRKESSEDSENNVDAHANQMPLGEQVQLKRRKAIEINDALASRPTSRSPEDR